MWRNGLATRLFIVKTALTAVFVWITACGSSEDEKKKENLESAVTLSILGKSLKVKDELYSLSCNQFYVKFLVTKNSSSCTAVSVDTVLVTNVWTIKSSDSTIDIEASQKDGEEVLTIDGTDYNCYLYAGTIFTEDGTEKPFGSHLILSKSSATKSSDLKTADVDYVAGDNELCEALY